jgi:signal transduction histidine kinase
LKLSLRARVLLLLALFNAVTFAVATPFLYQRLATENELSAEKEIGTLVRATVRPEGDLNVLRILEWPTWPVVADAMVVDQNLEVQSDGRLRSNGVVLNPVGSSQRTADFDTQSVLAAAKLAIDSGSAVDGVMGGRTVPIEGPNGIWGACWLRRAAPLDLAPIFISLLPWFLLSTLLLTGVTFFSLRQLVLKPVEELVDGARRVQLGDLETRLVEPRRQDELADLVRSFNAMTATVRGFNDRLKKEVELATTEAERSQAIAMTQRRLAAMGELAAGIAHEINNPLGGLMNAVDALQRGTMPPEKVDEYLRLLSTGLERIGMTVGQLLRFTPRESSLEPVNLVAVALDALALVRHRAKHEGVLTSLSLPGHPAEDLTAEPDRERAAELAEDRGVPFVQGARHELGQALLNLLVNALDAIREVPRDESMPPARIDLSLSVVPRGLELVVRDNGPGVAPDRLTHVANLFYTTKDVGKGTGLGLSMVHNIVDAHGGEVEITSQLGQGFVVTLLLPITKGGLPASGQTSDGSGDFRGTSS